MLTSVFSDHTTGFFQFVWNGVVGVHVHGAVIWAVPCLWCYTKQMFGSGALESPEHRFDLLPRQHDFHGVGAGDIVNW